MIKAVGKRVIVKVIEDKKPEGKTILIVPSRKEQVHAEIIAYSADCDAQMSCGDMAILLPDSGIQIQITGEEYLSINETQILAIITRE